MGLGKRRVIRVVRVVGVGREDGDDGLGLGVVVAGGVGVFVAAVGAVEGEAAGGFAVDEDGDVDGRGDATGPAWPWRPGSEK